MPDDETYIGEPIEPEPGSFDLRMMSTGIPGVPRRFKWRDRDYTVVGVIKSWKQLGACESGANEQYVRKHFYKVKLDSGEVVTLTCTRHAAKGPEKIKGRWVLYTVAA